MRGLSRVQNLGEALVASLFALWLTLSAPAQSSNSTPAGEAPGSWQFGTIGVGKSEDGKTPATTALKGVAIKVGARQEAAVAYDLDLCRMAGGWSGGKFVTPMNLMSRGEYPASIGEPLFLTGETAGLSSGEAAEWRDPRSEPYGPLPNVRYRGLYVSGDRTVLKWKVGDLEILESPWYEKRGGMEIFSRDFLVPASSAPLIISIGKFAKGPLSRWLDGVGDFWRSAKIGGQEMKCRDPYVFRDRQENDYFVQDFAAPEGVKIGTRIGSEELYLTLPPHREEVRFRIAVGFWPKGAKWAFGADAPPLADFTAWTRGGPAHWPEPVVTKGELSQVTGQPYVVDTVRLPDPNPWGLPVFVGGFDFFPDGRVALCTFHGDVFIGSGIDGNLKHVTWRRFATGLYHALGLKVVKGEIYVTGRDGITRLKDLNGDGEADFYEVFNWDLKVTKSPYEFVFDLQTDHLGNFLFAKAGPVKKDGRGFDEITEHHGCLFSVSPDGRELQVIATGLCAPNGLGAGPNGQITTGDNEGPWTPACRLNWINYGGFYGVVDLAHRSEKPEHYDLPLCWLPKRADNSPGSQVWVTSDKWGPWGERLLHLSYGQAALFGVLMEEAELSNAPDCCAHIRQGGVVQFPLKFESGIMRARFHPVDGQLYVGGLRGWQTTGLRNGCFQRVRYTGEPVRMPIDLKVQKDGVEITFTSSLDTQQALDPANWKVEVWNYIWSSASGSPEISTLAPVSEQATEAGQSGGRPEYGAAQLQKSHHDPLEVKSVTIGTDDRSVFLEIPHLKPVMQMSLKYRLRSADGIDFSGEILNTIHVVPES